MASFSNSTPPTRGFTESLSLQDLGNNIFETNHAPERMGNSLNIAYGGFALAVAVKAAAATIPSHYHLYSIMGHYLGPALTDRPLRATSRTIRQTRTFATRQVEVSQRQDDGSERVCLVALADFQVAEKASLLEFSVPPSKQYSSWRELEDGPTQAQRLVEAGKVSQELVDVQNTTFGVMGRFFETRPCPEGIFAQRVGGLAKSLPTTQDHLPLVEKSTADWMRSTETFPDQMDNMAALAFYMDGALSFAPLVYSGLFLDDSAACSSLDFALRVFSNDVDMRRWHLREIQTRVGAEGRTYNEARIWDESGHCVASMTQANILRPLKKENGKL